MLEIKTTVAEINNAFAGLINTLDTAKERTSKPKEMSTEISKTEMQRKNIKKNWISKNCEAITKICNICIMRIPQGREKKDQKKMFEATIENFSKLMSDTKPHVQEAHKT